MQDSVSKAFTIHGTSKARIEASTIYNHRGAAIYLENGAEHNNVVIGNAITCEIRSNLHVGGEARCAVTDGAPSQIDSDYNEQAGIYMTGMFGAACIGNAVSGMDNALFVNQASGGLFRPEWGKDRASRKVAPAAMRMDEMRDNVFHDNDGFGWYANKHSLLQTQIDDKGYVTDWKTACPWDFTTGADFAAPAVVRNHIEYGNNFGFGAYDLGDISCFNCSLLYSDMGTYWKVWTLPLVHSSTYKLPDSSFSVRCACADLQKGQE